MQGLWGKFILIIFAMPYALAVRSAWRSAYHPLAVPSVIGLVFSFLAGFSNGGFYLPAALGLFVGMLLLTLPRLLRPRSQEPSG